MCIWNAGPGALAGTGPVHVLMIAHSHQAPSYGAIAHENGAVCALAPLRECADSCIKPLGFHQGLKSPEFHLYVTRNDYNKGHCTSDAGPCPPARLCGPLRTTGTAIDKPPYIQPDSNTQRIAPPAMHMQPCTWHQNAARPDPDPELAAAALARASSPSKVHEEPAGPPVLSCSPGFRGSWPWVPWG